MEPISDRFQCRAATLRGRGWVRSLWLASGLLLAAPGLSAGRSFRYTGALESRIRVRFEQNFDFTGDARDFELRTGKFVSFDGIVNRQEVERYQVTCDPRPDRSNAQDDSFGNPFTYLSWRKPGSRVQCVVEFTAKLETDLTPLTSGSDAPLPTTQAGKDGPLYLRGSKMLAQDDSEIRELAARLAKGARGQFEAVARVMNYVIDHVDYEVNPRSFAADHALETGRGNCQNYAHLATALLHDLGIEARVVYGLSLARPWKAPGPGGGTVTFDNAQGRHAWVEARLPDVGWVSFDPQSTQFFVSTHLVRQAVGTDSPKVSDSYSSSGGSLKVSEKISTEFLGESNTLAWGGEGDTPSELVLAGLVAPAAAGSAPPVAPPPRPKPLLVVDPRSRPEPAPSVDPHPRPPRVESPVVASPKPVPPQTPVAAAPTRVPPPLARPDESPSVSPSPATSPNPSIVPTPALTPTPSFQPPPELPSPSPSQQNQGIPSKSAPPPVVFDDFAEIGLLDLSEDAYEYATSKEVYAQRFEIRQSLLLWEVELALQKFGGEGGSLWVEILEDAEGWPGNLVRLTSGKVSLAEIPRAVDYDWVPFSFRSLGDKAVLEPGRYWLALRFTEDAIVNWHCRIGNPYLDPDDTRSRPASGGPWNNLLHVDFNFLLTGLQ